jgi:Inovirus Coat protein B
MFKFGTKHKLAALAALSTVSSAMAAVPESVTSALTESRTDALAVAGLALVVIISIAAFKYMRRGV